MPMRSGACARATVFACRPPGKISTSTSTERRGHSTRCSTASSGPTPSPHPAILSPMRSEEHTSELQSLMRISYAVFCLKKKRNLQNEQYILPKNYEIKNKHLVMLLQGSNSR